MDDCRYFIISSNGYFEITIDNFNDLTNHYKNSDIHCVTEEYNEALPNSKTVKVFLQSSQELDLALLKIPKEWFQKYGV